MNRYRVDLTNTHVTPCSQASLLYLGDSLQQAARAFQQAQAEWVPANPQGVLLSVWNAARRCYEPMDSKGLPA